MDGLGYTQTRLDCTSKDTIECSEELFLALDVSGDGEVSQREFLSH